MIQPIQISANQLRVGDYYNARQTLQNIQHKFGDNPQSVDLLINQSTIFATENKLQETIDILYQALHIDAYDYRLYYNLFAVYCKLKQLGKAKQALKKCISTMYCIMTISSGYQAVGVELERAIELWDQNTAAYVLKGISLINRGQLLQANQISNIAIQKSLHKHHIYALCCIIDSRMEREKQRLKNAKNYHDHSLAKLIIPIDHQRIFELNTVKQEIKTLIKQFNMIVQRFQLGKFNKSKNISNVIFMEVISKTTVNIELEISKNLGAFDLTCITEQDDQEELNIKQTEQKLDAFKGSESAETVTYQQLKQTKTDSKFSESTLQFSENKSQSSQLFNSGLNAYDATTNVHQKGDYNSIERPTGDENPWPKVTSWKKNEAQTQKTSDKYKEHRQKSDNVQLYPIKNPTFYIKLILANLDTNQQLFGKMDPYVFYKYEGQKIRTNIAKGQGQNPRWHNEVHKFTLSKSPSLIQIQAWDHELFKWDDKLGQTQFMILKTGLFILPLYLNNQRSGELVIHISQQPYSK